MNYTTSCGVTTFQKEHQPTIYLKIRRKFSGLSAAEKASHQPRVQLERDLTFAGFLVLVNPLKPDAPRVIHSLQKSSHKTIVITGDNVITAADVAKRVSGCNCFTF